MKRLFFTMTNSNPQAELSNFQFFSRREYEKNDLAKPPKSCEMAQGGLRSFGGFRIEASFAAES
jgi:hypothetical protein